MASFAAKNSSADVALFRQADKNVSSLLSPKDGI
jgi:hypothetical protein